MSEKEIFDFLNQVLEKRPSEWIEKTTHRLDLYNEPLAKVEFLDCIEKIFKDKNCSMDSLRKLPTAYDYIRLGHPLSCLLEWAVSRIQGLKPSSVVAFSSQSMPLFAILRKNSISGKKTQVFYQGELPHFLKSDLLKSVYGYDFDLMQVSSVDEAPLSDDMTVFISESLSLTSPLACQNLDFAISIVPEAGSLILSYKEQNEDFVSEIQHVRRRESIAMTPHKSEMLLGFLARGSNFETNVKNDDVETKLLDTIKELTQSDAKAALGSCGLSVQYAVSMGLIDHFKSMHPKKTIQIVVPPNCYGGTNDQARRIAASVENVEVVDLPVDSGNDMASSVERILDFSAKEDAIPLIIAEIPTNPRVQVPNLEKLRDALLKKRLTEEGSKAVQPVFILDQTFCPNLNFLGKNAVLSEVQTISYVSGSKFPSGGLCTAGYAVSNQRASCFMDKVIEHLELCGNKATEQQLETLAEQMPSMKLRIEKAYKNTRDFVEFIKNKMPEAKINFVSDELADQGFTPSVFSLDLPAQNEEQKRMLNHKLIKMMIDEIPEESQHCVSYGQLKGCYWTVPATSTQGTTKEGDKDYIVRVSCSPEMDLEKHKTVFGKFTESVW